MMTSRRSFLGVIGLTFSIVGLSLKHLGVAQAAGPKNSSVGKLNNDRKRKSYSKIRQSTNSVATTKGEHGVASNIPSENSYRPPYLTSFRSSDKPLTVLSTLLSRADSTPLTQRRRDPNLLLNREGKLAGDPVNSLGQLALESDPQTGYEKWCSYWRRVHGARFIRALEAGGIQSLLRYDQVHRVPSGPTSFDPPPYFAPVDKNARLFDSVIGHIGSYHRPQWDGIAYLAFTSVADLKTVLSQKEVQAKIIPEDQAIFRELTPVVTTEHIILPSQTQRDPILLIKTHERQGGINRVQFQERWLHQHADFVLTKPATHAFVKRYAQLHNVGPTQEGEPLWHSVASRIDGISVMAFANMNDVEDFLMTDDYKAIEADEFKICNPEKSEYWTAMAHNIVNQIHPERATKRMPVSNT